MIKRGRNPFSGNAGVDKKARQPRLKPGEMLVALELQYTQTWGNSEGSNSWVKNHCFQ